MWGQATPNGETYEGVRIIPTRVGTSKIKRGIKSVLQDHPHACGDKEIAMRLRTVQEGSSPRVWGQAKDGTTVVVSNGIIPTRVGTSIYGKKTLADDRDHPHACGDKASAVPVLIRMLGSSPRVWGQG